MRQTKHQARRKRVHAIQTIVEKTRAPRLKTGGALRADHYTGRVHYAGGGFDFWKDVVMPIKGVAEEVITTGMQIFPMFL